MSSQPTTLRLATWNALRDRADGAVRGNVRALLDDHPVHALAVQEADDYHDVLAAVPGYRLHGRNVRGDRSNAWLIREDVAGRDLDVFDLGGDGWTTVTGFHHVGLTAVGVTIAGWLRGYSVHLPPSINWPRRKPVGPAERVDDYVRAMQRLRTLANQSHSAAGGQLLDVRQRGHYGSDHPAVTFTVRQLQERLGLLYVGDWNCRPGRDEGLYTVSWLAREATMRVGIAPNRTGHLAGIDLPLLKQPAAAK